MHIPDAYLSPATEGVAFAVMLPIWTIAARRTSRELTTRQVPLLSIGAAFCFAIQMFNMPALGGTTAHALGAALLAILVGPWAAILGMTLTLGIQALLFGDGGILALGANCFSMAVVACFAGHFVFRLIAGGLAEDRTRVLIGAAAGAYVGTVAASLSAGLILGAQPLVAHDALGHALYFPFGWNIAIPAMTMTHLLIAGPVEAILTVAAVSYLRQAFPELVSGHQQPVGAPLRLVRRFLPLLLLTPLGLIAGGSAWGEWDLSEIKQMVGYAPAAMEAAPRVVAPVLPDYALAGRAGLPWEVGGYLLSALIGCAAVALFTRALVRQTVLEARPTFLASRPGTQLPGWMLEPNAPIFVETRSRRPWFDATLLKMRGVIRRALASSQQSNESGVLQQLHPTAKAIGFLSVLVVVGLSRSWLGLSLILVAGTGLALASKIDLTVLGRRIVSSAMFFGLVFAIPLTLQAVTAGPVAFRIYQVAFSWAGLNLGALLLLRLVAGLGVAALWHATTPWHKLLGSLRALGMPRIVVSAANLTYRYLFVVFDVLAEMVEARKSRQIGACDARQAQTYAGTGTAVLFAKSLALTEETHLAMISRGFDGGNRRPKQVQRELATSPIPAVKSHAI